MVETTKTPGQIYPTGSAVSKADIVQFENQIKVGIDGKADLQNSTKAFTSRANAVAAGQSELRRNHGIILTMEGDWVAVRTTWGQDDPLFPTYPYWGVARRLPHESVITAMQTRIARVDDDPLHRATMLPTHRPGDTPWLHSLDVTSGNPDAAPPLDLVSVGIEGAAARVVGAGIVADRALTASEPGRTYRLRFAVRRIVNTPDPAGDAVQMAVAYYNRDRQKIGESPIHTITDLVTGSGRQEWVGLISRGAEPDAVPMPESAVYFRPYVQTYGTTCQTDVEVIEAQDVTDLSVWSPDVSALETRLAGVESVGAGARLDILESEVGTPGTLRFTSRSEAQAQAVPATVDFVEVLGIGLYRRDPNGTALTTADGTKFSPAGDVTPEHFGATGSGVVVERDAVEAAMEFGRLAGREVTLKSAYRIDGDLQLRPGTRLIGPGVLEQCTLRGSGQTGVETTLITATDAGASALFVADASGFAVGDYVRVVSCINAQGPSAGDFILGDRRNANPPTFLAEFARIRSVDVNTLNLDTRLIFPYSTTPDGDSAGRIATSVIKVDFLDHVHVQDVTFRRTTDVMANQPLVAEFLGPNVRFERCTFDCNTSSYIYARPFQLSMSFGVKFFGCNFKGITIDALSASQGNCEIRSSQDIWIDGCNTNGGNQGIDITAGGFGAIGGPSIGVRIENSKFDGTVTDAITTHWGCYGTIIRANLVRSRSGNGIRIRSRNDVVEDNDLQGGPGASGAGIFISNIPFQGMRVRGNRVSGYRNQIRVSVLFEADYTIDDWPAGQLGLTISDNDLLSYAGGYGGILVEATNMPSAKPLNITLQNNTLRAIGAPGTRKGVFLSAYANGVTAKGNDISGFAAGVHISKNSADGIIAHNIMRDCAVAAIRGQTAAGTQIEDIAVFGERESAGYSVFENYYVRSPGALSIPAGLVGLNPSSIT